MAWDMPEWKKPNLGLFDNNTSAAFGCIFSSTSGMLGGVGGFEGTKY